MSQSQDGFYLAEQDLRIRGPGDLLGTRQSGEESFRMINLSIHSHLIPEAIKRGEMLHSIKQEDSRQEVNNLLSVWARKTSDLLRA
jgi:ATP-dependent DNA helicase RecG